MTATKPTKVEAERQRLIDHLLLYMSCADYKPMRGKYQVGKVSPYDFDGAEPLLSSSLALTHGHLDGYDDGIYFTDVEPSDLDSPLRVSVIVDDSEAGNIPGRFTVMRMRQVDPRTVRGRVKWVAPVMVETRLAFFNGDRPAEVTGQIHGRIGGNWQPIMAGVDPMPPAHNILVDHRLRVAYGMQFTRRYEWRVRIGLPGLPSIELPTDPAGAQELFRLRDKPEGKSRRAALRHWVEDHWRMDRYDPELERFVRKHLRGVVEFNWAGYQCRITPSTFDQEQAQRAVDERRELKKAGADVRLVN